MATLIYGAKRRIEPLVPALLRGPARRVWQQLRTRLPVEGAARELPGIPGLVHEEEIIGTDPTIAASHLRQAGESALENIDASLDAAGMRWNDLNWSLDLPCGYGRVLRFLVGKVSANRVTVCDLDSRALDFCVSQFGAERMESTEDLSQLLLPRKYSLIWVGSLFTHLPASSCLQLFDRLVDGLDDPGLLVFTTHGEDLVASLESYGREFSGASEDVASELARDGVAFRAYAGTPNYGVTFHQRQALRELVASRYGPTVSLVRFAAHGWDHHQDVWSLARAQSKGPDEP